MRYGDVPKRISNDLQLNDGGTPHTKEELDRVKKLHEESLKEYYAVYDEQVDGFKAGMVYSTFKKALYASADRAYELSQSDEEPCEEGLSPEEIAGYYGYRPIKVTKEDAEIILESEEIGLCTGVSGVDPDKYSDQMNGSLD